MRITYDRILIGVFALILALPGTLHLTGALFGGEKDTLAAENRIAAPFPTFSTATGLRGFTGGISAWTEDHFGLRTELIDLYTSLRDELGLSGIDGEVVIGKDSFLFLNHGDMLDDFQGLAPVKPAELREWVAAINTLKDKASAGGADFIYLHVPNKQSVYPEYLPDYIRPRPGARRWESLGRALRAAGVGVLDPSSPLTAGKESARIYHQTDTHWTSEGAYLAYRELVSALAEKGYDIPVVERGDLIVSQRENFRGDLTGLLGSDRFSETRLNLAPAHPVASTTTTLEREGVEETYWPVIHEQALPGAPSLMISGDSFSEALLPFLKQSFSRIVVIRRHPNIFYAEDFSRYQADIVVLEIVERLHVLPPEIQQVP